MSDWQTTVATVAVPKALTRQAGMHKFVLTRSILQAVDMLAKVRAALNMDNDALPRIEAASS